MALSKLYEIWHDVQKVEEPKQVWHEGLQLTQAPVPSEVDPEVH